MVGWIMNQPTCYIRFLWSCQLNSLPIRLYPPGAGRLTRRVAGIILRLLEMKTIDLAGIWELLQAGDESPRLSSPVAIRIPGDNLSALLEAGLIPDPYEGTRELELQWIGRSDWLLRRRFTVEPRFLEGRRAWLRLENVDSVAEVLLNGRPGATGTSSVVPLQAEGEEALRAGGKLLGVRLASPRQG